MGKRPHRKMDNEYKSIINFGNHYIQSSIIEIYSRGLFICIDIGVILNMDSWYENPLTYITINRNYKS